MTALALVLLLLAADTSAAHGPGRPDLWTPPQFSPGGWCLKEPPAGGPYFTVAEWVPCPAPVALNASCDLAELLAASRAWATLGPVTPRPVRVGITMVTSECNPCKCPMDNGASCHRWEAARLEREAEVLETQRGAEARWLRAVEACR